jgi:ribosomal protein S18 acetylase RimI-like enzyme
MTGPATTFRPAVASDAADVVRIVNGAYRGDPEGGRGWTTEADLVGGPRVDEPAFLDTIARPRSVVLVAERGGRVVGCVHLERHRDAECHLGMLSVDVREQAAGLGRALLAEAESYARGSMRARLMTMHVITARPELLAWYERRGYRRTGRVVPFEEKGHVRFLRGPLSFERLEKALA